MARCNKPSFKGNTYTFISNIVKSRHFESNPQVVMEIGVTGVTMEIKDRRDLPETMEIMEGMETTVEKENEV